MIEQDKQNGGFTRNHAFAVLAILLAIFFSLNAPSKPEEPAEEKRYYTGYPDIHEKVINLPITEENDLLIAGLKREKWNEECSLKLSKSRELDPARSSKHEEDYQKCLFYAEEKYQLELVDIAWKKNGDFYADVANETYSWYKLSW